MKNPLLVLFLFSITVNYSQNCLLSLDVKSYKTVGKSFLKKKHKNIQIILKTEECLCTENVFQYFITIKDKLLTIEETSGNLHTKYTSSDFTSNWLD